MAHRWTWQKLAQNAYRLNPKSRGPKYPYTPKFEVANYTSGPNRGQKVIVPFVGTKSVLISMRAWGVTQASLHNITMLFSDVDIKTENPMSQNYFQIKYEGKMYWIHKLDRLKNPLTSRCTCFTGDTEILLADGTFATFKDLEGKNNFEIIGYNEQEDRYQIVPAYNCEKKKVNSEILAVTLDNGQIIKCTPDHKFLTRQGQWVEAKDLTPDTSLRALYLNENSKRLLPDGSTQIISEYKGPDKFYIYVYLDPRYPGKYEYKTCSFDFKPIYVGKGCGSRDTVHLNTNKNDMFHNTVRSMLQQNIQPIILRQQVSLTEDTAYRIEEQLTREIGLVCEGNGPLMNSIHEMPKKLCNKDVNCKNELFVNHKVLKIDLLTEKQDVYCLTSAFVGNFVVNCTKDDKIKSGVVVSNCADFFHTFAFWNYNNGCLYGPKPRPYQRKTNWYPPRNPQHLPGICKHVYNAWAILRNSGLTIN